MGRHKKNYLSDDELIRKIVFEIQRVARKQNKSPYLLKQSEFLSVSKGNIYLLDLYRFGGYKTIVGKYFHDDVQKDHTKIREFQNHIKHVKKLEKITGNMDAFRKKVVKDVGDIVSRISIQEVNLDSKETQKFINSFRRKQSDSERRSIATIWSDHHFGTNVDPEEVGWRNEFNWNIGARRLALLCNQIATYKIEKREFHDELVIFLIGDNIGGVLHDQEGPSYDLLINQINGTTSYYKQAISYLKNYYKKIRVVCQPGNHGRVMHKANKARATCQKYDSFENIIFYSLSMMFKNDDQVKFIVSKSPYSDVKIRNTRIYATHGDTMFHTGNVGKIINMRNIEQQVDRINSGERSTGKEQFSIIVVGHVHHPMATQVSNGVSVIVNGSLIGSDPFAMSCGLSMSAPTQVVWELTDNYAVGDMRLIHVASGDNDKSLEKIIRPYKMELSA